MALPVVYIRERKLRLMWNCNMCYVQIMYVYAIIQMLFYQNSLYPAKKTRSIVSHIFLRHNKLRLTEDNRKYHENLFTYVIGGTKLLNFKEGLTIGLAIEMYVRVFINHQFSSTIIQPNFK